MTTAGLALSPEERLLLLCARRTMAAAQQAQARALATGPLDWAALVQKAAWHRLSALLRHHLRAMDGVAIPAAASQALDEVYRLNLARSLSQRAELGRLLDALAERRIPAVLLKGSVLRELVYRNPALRTMNDIDLLVREEHLETVDRLIQDMGYTPHGSQETQARTRAEHRHLPILLGQQRHVWFEVHHRLTRRDSPLQFDTGALWARAQRVTLAGRPALALCPEHMLLHLCVHFLLDRRYSSLAALAQLCDIRETLEAYPPGVDWEALMAEAARMGLQVPLYYGLAFAVRLLDARVPPWALEGLDVRPEPAGTDRFLRRRVLDTAPWLAHSLLAPGQRYSRAAALHALARRLVPGPVTLAERYGVAPTWPRIALYYPLRLAHALLSGLRAVGRPSRLREDLELDRWMHGVLGPHRTQS